MKFATTLAAIALSMTPGLALAGGGCPGQKAKLTTASSCMQGYVWDEAKGTCVITPSS
jgi:hypothetical protein